MVTGLDAIDQRVEDCLEAYESRGDIPLGLQAVQILQHFPERYQEPPSTMLDDILDRLQSATGDALLEAMHQALDSHRTTREVERRVYDRVEQLNSLEALLHDDFVGAYLEVVEENE